MVEVSGSLIVKNNSKILMKNTEDGRYNIPQSESQRGELSADTALRAAEEATGCECEVNRYRKRLKTEFEMGEEKFKWHPYMVELKGEPKNCEWVEIDEIDSLDLEEPLEELKDKLKDAL